jgi:glycosyltransferase involved in cell wall biosynthesis
MNALVSVNLDDLRPERLPPREREGPARLLFLSTTRFGFRNYHNQIIHYAEQRDDLVAVHIDMRAPLWLKVLGKSLPMLGRRGWDLHSYRYMRLWGWLVQRWLRGPLPIDCFDLIHVIGPGNAYALPPLLQGRSTRFAVNLDRTELDLHEHFGYSRAALRPFCSAERRIFDAADLLVCRNRCCGESLRRQFNVCEERLHVARNSMKPPPVSRLDRPQRSPEELPRVVFVARWFGMKGGHELLSSHQRRWCDQAQLHIVSGEAKPDPTARNVVWHGEQPRERIVNEILPDMDVFVLPTTHDMHPWAILEAAAVGLPVVSTRVFGVPEMVIDGETGLLGEPNDWAGFEEAVLRLVADPDLRFRFGQAARRHVETNYDPDDTYGRLLDRLVELANTASQSAGPR